MYHVTSGTNDLREVRGSMGLDRLHLSNTSIAKSVWEGLLMIRHELHVVLLYCFLVLTTMF